MKVLTIALCLAVLVTVSVGAPSGSCEVKGVLFAVGSSWREGCKQTCKCEAQDSISCVDICAISPPPAACPGSFLTVQDPQNPCCALKVCPKPTCMVKGIAYNVGESWREGCKQTCKCEAQDSISCVDICAQYAPPSECPNTYVKIQDPNNSCCTLTVCPKTAPSCKVKGVTYKVGESWREGCKQTCKCESQDSISCVDICAISPPPAGCPTTFVKVQDPSNPCCALKVCPAGLATSVAVE